MNKLNEWMNSHKEEIATEQEKSANQGKKVRKLEDKDVIVLETITEVSESVFEFNKSNGDIQKVKRYFYHVGEYVEEKIETHPWLIPKSVHMAIMENTQEFGDKLQGIKIKKKGTGKETEYTVFPIME